MRTRDLDSSMKVLDMCGSNALRSREEECNVNVDDGAQLGFAHPLAPGLALDMLAFSPSSAADEPLLMFEFDDESEWK